MDSFWQKLNCPILALAPMAGITDSAFRQVCRENGADIVYSEMASSAALFYQPEKTLRLLKFNQKESPYIIQLFGNDPKHFKKATEIITKELKPDGIDINFGCPARKVFKIGAGCAIMMNKKLARKIIQAVTNNTHLPISIKIRAGIEKYTAMDFVENLRDLSFSAIMVHGRTYEEKFSGNANMTIVEKIKAMMPEKIVLANGGIFSPEEAVRVIKKYPTIDGIGIARGAWGNPFIFSQIKNLLRKPDEIKTNSAHSFSIPEKTSSEKRRELEKIKKIMLRHYKLAMKNKGESGTLEVRKHLAWYIKGLPDAKKLKQELFKAGKTEEIEKILNKYIG